MHLLCSLRCLLQRPLVAWCEQRQVAERTRSQQHLRRSLHNDSNASSTVHSSLQIVSDLYMTCITAPESQAELDHISQTIPDRTEANLF